MKILKLSGLLKVLSDASMYSLGQWAIIIPPSTVSSGEAMPTKLSMPSCSALPDIWTTEMDLYIIRVVFREKVRPLHLTELVKNRFPELLNYALTENAIRSRIHWLVARQVEQQRILREAQ
ncbi:hypothetical protein JMJ35_000389 [Cladonia borealis]|uniref:Uncharacterized protein n=1 Tax=Cladonia borealis TaxID=184061 RepID=A0AA39RB08_9LECA|nr:hypothetical protein JMJ35_000389 [Cladonia borealis]